VNRWASLLVTTLAAGCSSDEAGFADVKAPGGGEPDSVDGPPDSVGGGPDAFLGEAGVKGDLVCISLPDAELLVGDLPEPFVAWADGDILSIQVGSEGGLSISLRGWLRGTEAPTAVAVRVTLEDGEVLAEHSFGVSEPSCAEEGWRIGPFTANVVTDQDPIDLLGGVATLDVTVHFADSPDLGLSLPMEITL
jgi:hypothetical protein